MFPMTKTDEKMVYGERASEQALLRLRQSKRNRESFLSAAENAYSAQLAFKQSFFNKYFTDCDLL